MEIWEYRERLDDLIHQDMPDDVFWEAVLDATLHTASPLQRQRCQELRKAIVTLGSPLR